MLAAGVLLPVATARLGLTAAMVWGRTTWEEDWARELAATLDANRPQDMAHGAQRAYAGGRRKAPLRRPVLGARPGRRARCTALRTVAAGMPARERTVRCSATSGPRRGVRPESTATGAPSRPGPSPARWPGSCREAAPLGGSSSPARPEPLRQYGRAVLSIAVCRGSGPSCAAATSMGS